MKKIILLLGLTLSLTSYAQEDTKGSLDISADLVSRYVWRGLDFGNSPAIQPSLSYTYGGFSAGAWGSYSLTSNTSGTELDLFASYAFDFGLSFTVTDYYFPIEATSFISTVDPETGQAIGTTTSMRSGDYFDYKNEHAFEFGIGQSIGNFSLSANYFFSNSMNNDMYFEASYDFSIFSIFAGAGNESHTYDGKFDLVNLGITTTKDINFKDAFTLPVFGSVILNPNVNQFHFVVGLTI